jgi:cell division protein FtsN
MAAPTQGNDTKPSIVDPEKAPRATAEKTAMKPNPTSGGVYSVQVAAYNHKADAEKLVGTLIKRGYSARVDGTVTPFRVRIGRYATENDAENALKRIKAKHMDGFVARVSER